MSEKVKYSLEDRPKLRWPLEVNQVQHENQSYHIINDPLGLCSQPAAFPSVLIPLIGRLDGIRTLRSIVEEGRQYGVTEDLLIALVQELDSLHLLDSDLTKSMSRSINEEFKIAATREAAFAGRIYPADEENLLTQLNEFVSAKDVIRFEEHDKNKISALICPHIDYRRGWMTYASAYTLLEDSQVPDVIFLLGTAHQFSKGIFHLTKKHFNTPIGSLHTDQEIVRNLAKLYGEGRSYSEELLHKNEHSLELQLPFIIHRYRGRKYPTLVPILVGSFYQCLRDGLTPGEVGEISDFISALANILKGLRLSGKTALLYGGVDLAHVGMYFGDNKPVSEEDLNIVKIRDKEFLDHAMKPDSSKVFNHIAEDNDARRICGFPSIYTMVEALTQSGQMVRGHCLDYRQAVDKPTDCVVTFASAYWASTN